MNNSLSVGKKLSLLDRFLPVWIIIAMIIGFLLGYIEGITEFFNAVQIGTTSLPIAIGLLWMMYPVLAKVKYEELSTVFSEKKMFATSMVLNWIIGPFLMFFLAILFLADEPEFMEGLILIGLARCIAMVLIWSMLAGGDNEDTAILVAINSVFQVIAYSIYAYFFIGILPGWFGIESSLIRIPMVEIATSVLIFLGIPIIAGMLTRYFGIKKMGKESYDNKLVPKLGPTALIGLLFTIIVMFSLQGKNIIDLRWKLIIVAAPLIFYFIIMFIFSYVISWKLKFNYSKTVSLSFTAASNNFELAIAVAVGTYGIQSKQAITTVIGPLIEVPILIGLVYFSYYLKKYFFTDTGIPKNIGKS